MDNDQMFVKIKDMFDTKVDEVKGHMQVIAENLESKIQIVAEGHDIMNRKIDRTKSDIIFKIDETKLELTTRIDKLDKDIEIVKDYAIGVDTKLNEHEVILKRVK